MVVSGKAVASAKRRADHATGAHPPTSGAKRQKKSHIVAEADAAQVRVMKAAVHQIGLVGGDDYDSKEDRLAQLLDRISSDAGTTLVLANPASVAAATAIVKQCRNRAQAQAARERAERARAVDGMAMGIDLGREHLEPWTCGQCTLSNAGLLDACPACGGKRGAAPKVVVAVVEGGSSSSSGRGAPWESEKYQLVINFDLPRNGADYVRRLGALHPCELQAPAPPRVCYTFVEEKELKRLAMKEIIVLLRSTRLHADDRKAAELDSALQLVEDEEEDEDEEDWDEEEDWDDEEEGCDCAHCRGSIIGSTSYHPLLPVPGVHMPAQSGVEVVRLPLRALEDFDRSVPFIAPRIHGHSATLICLHCLNVHTPWDGWEQYFAPPGFMGTLRVVLVLADNVSWHDYLDSALVGCGGSSWVDILDMDSMDRTDMLLERLVDHEAALLDGHSERIVLMGMSQGGGQSMLRFLRSTLPLGGLIGSVCHVPTAPHTPRDRDSLVSSGRPRVNLHAPIRLLAGECDTVFPLGLVLRDAARLRNVGGFTNVEVEVRKRMAHEGPLDRGYDAALGFPASLSAGSAASSSSGAAKKPSPKKGGAERTTAAARQAAAAAAQLQLQQSKARLRAERRVPELCCVQKFLPMMVPLSRTAPAEDC